MQWSFPFLAPVDTTKYLDYLTVVKQPMDLGSIKQRLESGGYRDPQVRRHLGAWLLPGYGSGAAAASYLSLSNQEGWGLAGFDQQ